MENVELIFLEPCKKILISSHPEMSELFNKISATSDLPRKNTSPRRNAFLLYCIMSVLICYILSKLLSSRLISTKLKQLKSFLVSLVKSNPEPVLAITKEIVEEWQQLFQKAKLFDTIMIKQLLCENNRSSSSRNLQKLRRSSSTVSDIKTKFCWKHSMDEDVIQLLNPFNRNRSAWEMLTKKSNNDTTQNQQSVSTNSAVTLVETKSIPKFVVTEDLLKIKQTFYDTKESFC